MSTATTTAVDQFLQTWVDEFTRAVEMFSGQVPVLRCSRTKSLAASQITDLSWWQQDFAGDGKFSTWIGVNNDTMLAFGGGDPAEAKPTYLEMLGQAQSGAAHVVSAGFDTPIKCEPGQEGEAPPLEGLLYGLIGITFDGKELPALVFAMEPAIEKLLNPEDSEPAAASPGAASGTSFEGLVPASSQPMLSRLMELELPLSIALGRASMPIREVLKVTSGSVIELDKNVGDFVELLVHGTVVARGEVVSVKGNYGVRIKEIISQQDRMHLYRKD